jgi:acyl transferase domain-containing protein
LIFKLLQESMVARDDILSINLHGTGTALGDPIEIGALDTVYDSIASVKYLGMSYVLNICIHFSQLR